LAAIFEMRLVYLQIFLLTIGTAYTQGDCIKYPENYIPKDLDDALTYLNCSWTDKNKEDFKSKDESDAVTELHMGTGLGIRNGWELWKAKNSLYRFFKSKGIFHPDDISSIILTSFHRQLNKRQIDLENQIQHHKDYWKNVKEESKKQAEKKSELDKAEFATFQLGDKVTMKFSQSKQPNYLHLFNINKDSLSWDDNGRVCLVHGLVRGKKILKKYDYILVIELVDICGAKKAFYGDGAKDNLVVGKRINYNIRYYNIAKD
jgi:hypothetical protein